MSADQLQEAYRLIRDGRRAEAAQVLVPIVRTDMDNADAWWLLANAVTDPNQQRRALEQVLRLRPDDERARRMLERLSMPPAGDPIDDLLNQAGNAPPPRRDPYSSRTSDPYGSAPYSQPPVTNPFDDPGYGEVRGGRKRREDIGFDAPPVVERERVVVRERRGCNPFSSCFGVLGCLTLLACALCVIAPIASVAFLGPQVDAAIASLEADPNTRGAGLSFRGMVDLIEAAFRGDTTELNRLSTFVPQTWAASGASFDALQAQLDQQFPNATFEFNVEGLQQLSTQLQGSFDNISVTPQPRGIVEYNQDVSQTNRPVGDIGVWTFSGGAGDSVSLRVNVTGGTGFVTGSILGPEGAEIQSSAGGSGEFVVDATLNATGQHQVLIASAGANMSYTFVIERK